MSSFTNEPTIRHVKGRTFEVVDGFTYKVGNDAAELIVIPPGFQTDFASIPRGLWNLWPPVGGDYDNAAIVHDMGYRHLRHRYTRKQVDDIFREAMEVLGVGRFTRYGLWSGVRVGGWKPWGDYERTERDAQAALRAAGSPPEGAADKRP